MRYIHETCPTSLKLLIKLQNRGLLLDDVKIISVSQHSFLAIDKGVLSVPAIFVNGIMTASGIIDFDSLNDLLKYPLEVQRSVSFNLNELTVKLLRGILDNLVTTIWFYFSEDIAVFLEYFKFINALLQLYDLSDNER